MSNTPIFNLPKPDPAANVNDEFYRLQQAWDLLDTILSTFQQGIAGKAPADHSHPIDKINGLVDALAGKMPANRIFKVSDLTDVIGAVEAATGYVLVKNVDGKYSFASAASLLGNHGHSMDQIVGLSDALNARYGKGGGILTGFPILGFNYPQIWFGQAATGTGWRILKDNVEGQVGNLVFQFSTDRWSNTATTIMYMSPDGKVRFPDRLQALSGIDAFGSVSVQAELYVKAAIELGNMGGQAGFAVLDFHTSATLRDYNCRIICDSNANDGNGLGAMNILAGNVMWNGSTLWSTGNLGYLAGGEAEAGTSEAKKVWSAADVKRAIAALAPPGLARGQYAQDASRSVGTTYQNVTDRPIFVGWLGGGSCVMQSSADNVNWINVSHQNLATGYWPVPPGHFYKWLNGSLLQVRELRG